MPTVYDVIITPDAEADLQEIYDYIAYTLLVPETANSYVDNIENAILNLDTFPTGYPFVDFEPWRSRGLRFIPVKNFIVYFVIREELSSVYIMNVIYNKRNQLRALERKI